MKRTLFLIIIFFINTGVTNAQNVAKKRSDWDKKIVTHNPVWDLGRDRNISSAAQRYDVLNYDLNFTIFPQEKYVKGNASITLIALAEIDTFLCFDFAGLELDSVLLNKVKVESYIEYETLFIHIPTAISTNDTTVAQIFYHGTPEKGLYSRENKNGERVLYSFNEPFDAHYWFPCKDDPSDKALLDMKVTVPKTYFVLSNGLLIDEGNLEQDMKYWYWQESYPIATYLISLVAGPYVIVDQEYSWQSKSMPLQYSVVDSTGNR